MGSCRARSVYLTTHLLGRLSPLSGLPVVCTFFRQKLTTGSKEDTFSFDAAYIIQTLRYFYELLGVSEASLICLDNHLRRLDTVDSYLFFFFSQGRQLLWLRLFFCTPIPFWRGVYSKRKEFAAKGRVGVGVVGGRWGWRIDSFTVGSQNNFDRVASLESVWISLNMSRQRLKINESNMFCCFFIVIREEDY